MPWERIKNLCTVLEPRNWSSCAPSPNCLWYHFYQGSRKAHRWVDGCPYGQQVSYRHWLAEPGYTVSGNRCWSTVGQQPSNRPQCPTVASMLENPISAWLKPRSGQPASSAKPLVNKWSGLPRPENTWIICCCRCLPLWSSYPAGLGIVCLWSPWFLSSRSKNLIPKPTSVKIESSVSSSPMFARSTVENDLLL